MKRNLLLSGLLLLTFSAFAQQHLQAFLKDKKGNGPFMISYSIIIPTTEKTKAKTVPNSITEYVIRQIDFQSYNTKYKSYSAYGISKEEFVKHYEGIDSNLLTDKAYNHAFNVLLGTNVNDQLVVIIDQNNNASYDDDKVYTFDKLLTIEEQKKAKESLPSILLPFEFYDGEKIMKRPTEIVLDPYKASLGMSLIDTIENKYFLQVTIPKYRKEI